MPVGDTYGFWYLRLKVVYYKVFLYSATNRRFWDQGNHQVGGAPEKSYHGNFFCWCNVVLGLWCLCLHSIDRANMRWPRRASYWITSPQETTPSLRRPFARESPPPFGSSCIVMYEIQLRRDRFQWNFRSQNIKYFMSFSIPLIPQKCKNSILLFRILILFWETTKLHFVRFKTKNWLYVFRSPYLQIWCERNRLQKGSLGNNQFVVLILSSEK